MDFLFSFFIFPFQYEFMQVALLSSICIGITCSLLGTYVILRRMAFIGDALSHTALPGIVIAFLIGASTTLGALTATLITAVAIGFLSSNDEIREDTAIGILFTSMFALGVLLISTQHSYRDFTHMLFGNILGVTVNDLVVTAIICLLTILILVLFHKELELTSVDPLHARTIGISPNLMRQILLLLLAVAVITAIKAVGVVLTSALLITPAATGALFAKKLLPIMICGSMVSVIAAGSGILVSYHADVASGAAIVLSCSLIFAVLWLTKTFYNTSVKP